MKELAEFVAAFLDLPDWIALGLIFALLATVAALCFWSARAASRRGYDKAEAVCRHGFEKYDKTVRL